MTDHPETTEPLTLTDELLWLARDDLKMVRRMAWIMLGVGFLSGVALGHFV